MVNKVPAVVWMIHNGYREERSDGNQFYWYESLTMETKTFPEYTSRLSHILSLASNELDSHPKLEWRPGMYIEGVFSLCNYTIQYGNFSYLRFSVE